LYAASRRGILPSTLWFAGDCWQMHFKPHPNEEGKIFYFTQPA